MSIEPNAKTVPATKSSQVIGLDLIRFGAALLVVAYHLGFWTNVSHPELLYKFTLLEPYARHGFVGVDIFFVLSGIVIAYSAERSTALRFAESRVLRLYPAVWICSTITLIVFLRGPGPYPGVLWLWLKSLVLYPIGPWIDWSYWTLGIEMFFYSLIFVLLLGRQFRRVAPLMTLIGLLSSAALVYSNLAQRTPTVHGTLSAGFLGFFENRIAYLLLLLHHGPLFALGVLIWLCFYHGFTPRRVIALAVSLAGSVLAVHAEWAGIVAICGYRFSSAPSLLIWIAAMIAIVLSLAYNRQIAGAVGPRGARLARAAGLATYPLYLIHQQVGDNVIHRLSVHMAYPVALALCSAALLAFSFAVVPYVERPLQNFLKRLLHMPRRSVQPSASLP